MKFNSIKWRNHLLNGNSPKSIDVDIPGLSGTVLQNNGAGIVNAVFGESLAAEGKVVIIYICSRKINPHTGRKLNRIHCTDGVAAGRKLDKDIGAAPNGNGPGSAEVSLQGEYSFPQLGTGSVPNIIRRRNGRYDCDYCNGNHQFKHR